MSLRFCYVIYNAMLLLCYIQLLCYLLCYIQCIKKKANLFNFPKCDLVSLLKQQIIGK